MNNKRNAVSIAGGFVVTLAVMLLIFLVMILYEYIHPRQIPLTITTPGAVKVYDGQALFAHDYRIVYGELQENHELHVFYENQQETVGSVLNSVTVHITDEKGNDVTDLYSIETRPGTLSVTSREIHLVSDDYTKYYDGKAISHQGYRLVGGELAPGHSLFTQQLTTQTLVGVCENQINAVVVNEKNENVTDQYAISYTFGTFTVLPRKITVGSESSEKVYDGSALSHDKCELLNGSLASGDELNIQAVGKQILAGQSLNLIQATVTNKDGENVSEQYDITYQPGTLTVTPRKLSIKSADAEKIYDGEPLVHSGWELLAGEVCDGHRIEIQMDGKQMGVGECENRIVYVMIYDDSGQESIDVTSCYQVEYYFGLLCVYPPM